MDLNEIKQRVIVKIDSLQDEIWNISVKLYENPEIAFEEFQSAEYLANLLERAGFDVQREVGGLKTAFQAVHNGKGNKPTIAFLAEYDALPELGHACGHNLIAAAALGAGMGMLSVLDALPGQIRVIGTPAEEGGGGKRIMVEAGVFDDIDTAMMMHPSAKNMVSRGSLASMRLKMEFFGKPAHAAARPQEGINALDAMLLTFNNINALRQHLEPKDRVAGIIRHGGDAANIIPMYTTAEFSVRGENEKRREQVLAKVLACAEAAAHATGCKMKYEALPGYSEIVPNRIIGELFSKNLNHLGREITPPEPYEPMGSTDMGNVSNVIPAIHPYMATVSEDIPGHTVEFREACMSATGKAATLDSAKAMAMTAVDLMFEPSLLVEARSELDAYLNT
jgi:amidohydrolase